MRNSAETLIKRIRAEIERQDLTTRSLAEMAGMHQPQLSQYLTGKSVPSLEVIDRIAEALGTTPWELLKPQDASEDPLLTEAIDAVKVLISSPAGELFLKILKTQADDIREEQKNLKNA